MQAAFVMGQVAVPCSKHASILTEAVPCTLLCRYAYPSVRREHAAFRRQRLHRHLLNMVSRSIVILAPEQEKHELEEQRQQLLEEVAAYRRKIAQLEDDLLFRLSNSQARPGHRSNWLCA